MDGQGTKVYVATGGGSETTEVYNFATDEWYFVETAPRDFTYLSFTQGSSLYCLPMGETWMWVYTHGKGWKNVENDGSMSYDLGRFVFL